MEAAQGPKPAVPIGFRTLQEIVGYVATDDGQIVKINVVVTKIATSQNPDGSPHYNISISPLFNPVTLEEYRAMVKGDINNP